MKIGILLVLLAYFLSGCASQKKTAATAATPATTPAAAQAAPAKKAEAKPKGVECVNGTDKRTIEVVKANVCEVAYTKNSTRESVASSTSSVDYCNEVAKRIQKNLEAGGFTCKM